MIFATGTDGIRRRIILNENIILVDRLDNLSFPIIDHTLELEFTINVSFSDEGDIFTTSGDVSDDGKTWHLILHRWDGDMDVEVTKPIESTTLKDNKKLWLKFKTRSNKKMSYRNFHITLWVQE
jgi:hypothetical protein